MREVGELDSRGRPRVFSLPSGESRTIQSDAHLADIQHIMAAFGAGGMAALDEAALEYRDVSDFGDFADVMNEVRAAETAFMQLPSKVREIFGHDVATWLDTAHDEDKRDALVKAGFLEAEVVEPVVPDPPVAPVAPVGEEVPPE